MCLAVNNGCHAYGISSYMLESSNYRRMLRVIVGNQLTINCFFIALAGRANVIFSRIVWTEKRVKVMWSLPEILAKALLECHLQLRIATSSKRLWKKSVLFREHSRVNCALENTFYNETFQEKIKSDEIRMLLTSVFRIHAKSDFDGLLNLSSSG